MISNEAKNTRNMEHLFELLNIDAALLLAHCMSIDDPASLQILLARFASARLDSSDPSRLYLANQHLDERFTHILLYLICAFPALASQHLVAHDLEPINTNEALPSEMPLKLITAPGDVKSVQDRRFWAKLRQKPAGLHLRRGKEGVRIETAIIPYQNAAAELKMDDKLPKSILEAVVNSHRPTLFSSAIVCALVEHKWTEFGAQKHRQAFKQYLFSLVVAFTMVFVLSAGNLIEKGERHDIYDILSLLGCVYMLWFECWETMFYEWNQYRDTLTRDHVRLEVRQNRRQFTNKLQRTLRSKTKVDGVGSDDTVAATKVSKLKSFLASLQEDLSTVPTESIWSRYVRDSSYLQGWLCTCSSASIPHLIWL
jgi:hypothetical protein